MPGFFPQLGDIVEARACCYTADQIGLNVTHWVVTNTVAGGAPLDSIALQLDANWHAVYKAFMSPNAFWRGVGVRNLTAPRTTEFANITNDGPGTAAGTNSSLQGSGLISSFTGLGGRRGHGRFYPPFPGTTMVSALGELTALGFTAISNIAAVVGTSFNVAVGLIITDAAMLVRNKDLPGPPPVPQGTPVLSLIPRNALATQRRRGQLGRTNPLPF